MTSKAYQIAETDITWLSSTGTALITLTSLASGAGRQGALHDFGASAFARDYAWRAWIKFATAPVVGEVYEIYWKTSDGAHPDNDDGTGDLEVSAEDKLKNLTRIGTIIVDEASATPEFAASGFMEHFNRYGAPVVWNRTADALSATALDHGFKLTPIPMQGQDT